MKTDNAHNVFQTSWIFLKAAFKFLGANKDLILFPILSLIALIIFLSPTIFIALKDFPFFELLFNQHVGLLLGLLAIIYFGIFFIIIFFNAALIATATKRLNNEVASVMDGIRIAGQHFFPLLGWCFISATVGFIISLLERSHDLVEEAIDSFIGLTWVVTAYFVLPILVLEDVGPISALKRSKQIFGKGWKKIVNINVIFGLIGLMIFLVIYGLNEIKDGNLFDADIGIILFIAWIAFSAMIGSTFNAIVTSALYLHIVKGNPPNAFDRSLLNCAFVRKGKIAPF